MNPSSDKEDAAISKVLGGNKKKVLRISDDEDDVRINTVFSTPEKSSKKAKRLNENITEIIEEQHIETTKPEELVVSEKKPFK